MRIISYISYALTLICLSACVDKSWEGTVSEMNEDEKLPVHVIVGDPGEILESKGSGPMEDSDPTVWEGKQIRVYAFRREISSDYSTLSASGSDDCLIDGSCDEEGSLGGKTAGINSLDSYISWSGSEDVIYYKAEDHPYDFFAYYIDKPVPDSDIYRSKDEVRIMMEIDGNQDIMSAYAELTEDQLNRPGFTEIDKADLITYSFSAWSARRNIHPTFYFRHHLTRIEFEMSPGSSESTSIAVDSIVVKSKKKALFTVAHKNPHNMGLDFSVSREYKGLALTEEDGSRLRIDKWKPEFNEDGSPRKTKIGGCLLVAPDKNYQLSVHVKETEPDGKVLRYENKLELNSPDGLAEMTINVEMQDWKNGGSFNYDEEDLMK